MSNFLNPDAQADDLEYAEEQHRARLASQVDSETGFPLYDCGDLPDPEEEEITLRVTIAGEEFTETMTRRQARELRKHIRVALADLRPASGTPHSYRPGKVPLGKALGTLSDLLAEA